MKESNELPVTIITFGVGRGPSAYLERACAFGQDTADENIRPAQAPKANAICERFLGSVRRECLDHFLILSERHLYRVMKEYRRYFNHVRPHQGIEQSPVPAATGS